jgi:hypothetical protein
LDAALVQASSRKLLEGGDLLDKAGEVKALRRSLAEKLSQMEFVLKQELGYSAAERSLLSQAFRSKTTKNQNGASENDIKKRILTVGLSNVASQNSHVARATQQRAKLFRKLSMSSTGYDSPELNKAEEEEEYNFNYLFDEKHASTDLE